MLPTLKFAVQGLPALERDLTALDRAIYHSAGEATKATAKTITLRAKTLVPVRTGTLRDAIAYEMKGNNAYVGIEAGSPAINYWYFVEFGTVDTTAHPYFRPAAESGRTTFGRNLLAMLGVVIETA